MCIIDLQIDECRRLWVIDTGRVGEIQYCPAQILIFDLNTDTLLHRYKVPNDQIKPGATNYITPVCSMNCKTFKWSLND